MNENQLAARQNHDLKVFINCHLEGLLCSFDEFNDDLLSFDQSSLSSKLLMFVKCLPWTILYSILYS